MLNGLQKGVEPTLVTCRGGRAQGTPPPCMQEHHGAAIPWGGPRPDPGGCRAVGDRTSQRPHPGQATATMSHAGAAPAAAPLPGTRWPGCAWSTEPRPPPPGDTRKVTAPRGQDPAPCGAGGDSCTPKPSHPAQHTHARAEGLEPCHQLLHRLPEGFQRRARLVHGEGLAVPAVWGGRARGVPVLRPLAGGRGGMCRTSLLPDLRVLCLQLVDLQPGEGGRYQQRAGGTLRRGVLPAPHPPRAAAGAAHRSGCCSPSSAAAPWPQRRPEPSSPPGTPAA